MYIVRKHFVHEYVDGFELYSVMYFLCCSVAEYLVILACRNFVSVTSKTFAILQKTVLKPVLQITQLVRTNNKQAFWKISFHSEFV